MTNMRQLGVVAWPVVAGALILASCGSDAEGAASRETFDLSNETTAYIVKEPVTTTSEPLVEEVDGTSLVSQTYKVQAGDYPIKVANDFGISLDELVNFNNWGSYNEFPGIGAEILIPPNANSQTAAPAPADPSVEAAPETPAGETIPDAGDNCTEGRHTVVANDIPLKLVDLYDVTLESLDSANAGNPAYKQFIPGQEIIIPAKADC